jgi:large subunit ribosomal protein L23
MALINFKKEKEVKAKKPAAKKETVKKENKETLNTGKWNILKSPCITEKAVNMSAQGNFYVFHVSSEANKIEIKKAVEEKYKVSVLDVRTINIPRKKLVRGKTEGFKSGYKKAIIKVKEGQKIEIVGQ